MNPLVVSFRVVGIYCYFEALTVNGVSSSSSVKDVMSAIQAQQEGQFFGFESGALPSGKEVVNKISYTFNPDSRTPYNTSQRPADGFRELENNLDIMPSLVWQYYRSVTGTIDGNVVELKLISSGQPSFADLSLDYYDPYFGSIPASFVPSAYNLTWRIVQLQLSPENVEKFQVAKQNVITTASARLL
jgi:hypothetical protein